MHEETSPPTFQDASPNYDEASPPIFDEEPPTPSYDEEQSPPIFDDEASPTIFDEEFGAYDSLGDVFPLEGSSPHHHHRLHDRHEQALHRAHHMMPCLQAQEPRQPHRMASSKRRHEHDEMDKNEAPSTHPMVSSFQDQEPPPSQIDGVSLLHPHQQCNDYFYDEQGPTHEDDTMHSTSSTQAYEQSRAPTTIHMKSYDT